MNSDIPRIDIYIYFFAHFNYQKHLDTGCEK